MRMLTPSCPQFESINFLFFRVRLIDFSCLQEKTAVKTQSVVLLPE